MGSDFEKSVGIIAVAVGGVGGWKRDDRRVVPRRIRTQELQVHKRSKMGIIPK